VKTKETARSRITLTEFALAGLALISLVVLLSYAFSFDGRTRDLPSAASSKGNVYQNQQRVIESQPPGSSASEQPSVRRLARADARSTTQLGNDSPAAEGRNPSPIAVNSDALREADMLGTEVSDPIVLIDPLPDQPLSELQSNQLAFMREQFVELLGGTDQDPTQPQYLTRWEQAQTLLDEEFRSFFGEEMFNRQQLLSVAASNP